MGFLKKLWIKFRSSLANPDKWLVDLINGGGSTVKSGVVVNEETAMNLSAVYCAVNVISGTVMQLPLILYKNDENGNRQREKNHPAYKIVHKRANPHLSIQKFKQIMTGHLVTWGNAYAFIDRNGAGQIIGLYPIEPHRITIDVKENEGNAGYRLIYKFRRNSGAEVTFDESEIYHMAGLGYDGIKGYSIITLARESIGLGLSTEEYGARYFGEGSHPGMVVSHPQKLSQEASKNLRESLNEKYSGLGKSHKLMLLEEGMKPEKIDFSPEDSQFLETRKFQITEIARWFNLPVHKLKDLDRSTNNNIEHQSMEFINYDMGVWLVSWESDLNWLFFGYDDALFVEFLRDSFLRGDTQSRYEAFGKAILSGFMTPNEVRERENLPKIEGGDNLFMPLNMIPIDKAGVPDQLPAPTIDANQQKALFKSRINGVFEALYKDAAGRFVRKEVNDLRNMLKVGVKIENLQRYYNNLNIYCEKNFLPIIEAHAKEITEFTRYRKDFDVNGWVKIITRDICQDSINNIMEIFDNYDIIDKNTGISSLLDSWERSKPAEIAKNEIENLWVRLGGNL